MSDDNDAIEITATELERTVDAAVQSMLAWAYPSDVAVRMNCGRACELAGVDYIESVAGVLEASRAAKPGSDPHPDQARWAVAAMFVDHVNTLRSQGHSPRLGICASGRPADARGNDVGRRSPSDDDDYGSLA